MVADDAQYDWCIRLLAESRHVFRYGRVGLGHVQHDVDALDRGPSVMRRRVVAQHEVTAVVEVGRENCSRVSAHQYDDAAAGSRGRRCAVSTRHC